MGSSARPGNFVSIVTLGLMLTCMAGELLAQSNRRGSGRRAGGPRVTQSTASSYKAPSFPRRLLPPAGALTSPANSAAGSYRQLNVPPAASGTYGGTRAPQVFYIPASVLPYTYSVGPAGTHQVQNIPVAGVQQQAPPPVVVVNQPPANPAPQVIFVNPSASPQQGGVGVPGTPSNVPPSPAAPLPAAPKPTEPVTVRISVTPADSSVYLDDDLLGSGTDLLRGLSLKPGVHVLEVAHSEHRSQRVVFGVGSTDPLEVVVDLTTERVGRRSRVR